MLGGCLRAFSSSFLPFILFFLLPRSSAPTPPRIRSTELYKISIQEESAVFNENTTARLAFAAALRSSSTGAAQRRDSLLRAIR